MQLVRGREVMSKCSRSKKILDVFYVLVIINSIWFCLVDFINQGVLSGTVSVIFGVFEIYMAYLLKNKHEWPIWIYMILGVLHLIFLPIRFLTRPLYIYLIAEDLFYIIWALVLSGFSKDIKKYQDGTDE